MLVFYLTIVFSVCSLNSTHAANDITSSTAQLSQLATTERILLDELDKVIEAEGTLQEVSKKRNKIAEHISKYTTDCGNPISSYHLVARFSTVWLDLFRLLPESASDLKDKINSSLTSTSDYDDAKRSLLHLQKVYNLSIPDLMSGNLFGRKSQPLSQFESVRIAIRAVSDQDSETGIKWLTHALNHHEPPLVEKIKIYHALSVAHAANGDFLNAVNFTMKALELDPKNIKYLKSLCSAEEKERVELDESDVKYFEICRESLEMPSINKNLNCELKQGTLVPYNYFKIEYLYVDPDIILFHEMISDHESNILISETMELNVLILGQFGPALTEETNFRSSKIGWLSDDDENPLLIKLTRRVEEATGLNLTHPTGEPLQMANYGTGGQYKPHYDYMTAKAVDRDWLPLYGIDRIATFMFYLSDVELGGSTVFPKLNLAIRPLKNSAVFWFNYDSSGYPDNRTLHAGCPVLIGEKWVANKWVRSLGNEFNRPCPKTQDLFRR